MSAGTARKSFPVSVASAITTPAQVALPAIETILVELARDPDHASLALNIRELHLPFEAIISVPTKVTVSPGQSRFEWRLVVQAAGKAGRYPRFEGVMTLLPAPSAGSQIELAGTYTVPFEPIGRAIDRSLLRGAARSSLKRFVREVGNRVAALSHWAQYV